jgi:predicted esterase
VRVRARGSDLTLLPLAVNYRTHENDAAVVLEPTTGTDSSVIWLHGLGADGHDFVPIVPELRLPDNVQPRFVFPHASVRPVTINNGYAMRAWYDIVGTSLASREDEAGIRASEQVVRGRTASLSRAFRRAARSRYRQRSAIRRASPVSWRYRHTCRSAPR